MQILSQGPCAALDTTEGALTVRLVAEGGQKGGVDATSACPAVALPFDDLGN